MDEIFERYCEAVKKQTKGAQIGIYSVALIGLTVAIRRVRPISRFVKPSDVPNFFIRKRKQLDGYVHEIDLNGSLLMVQHKPPISLPFRGKKALPVKIFGVDVNQHGRSWLKVVVAQNEVKFIPISKEKDFVRCEVTLPQLTKKKQIRNVNLAESLLEIGFANLNVKEIQSVSPNRYIRTLKAAEQRAERKKLGWRYYITPTKLILGTVATKLTGTVASIYKGLVKKASTTKVPKVVPT